MCLESRHMATTRPKSTRPFAVWLDAKIAEKTTRNSVRELARSMAGPDASQIEIERHRRNLNRYRYDGLYPTDHNRDLIAQALGLSEQERDEMPDDDEDEEAALSLDAVLQALVEQRVSRALAKAGLS